MVGLSGRMLFPLSFYLPHMISDIKTLQFNEDGSFVGTTKCQPG
jgi:hypothetical protein